MCNLQSIQYFYRNMEINGFGSHCHSALSPGAWKGCLFGPVACPCTNRREQLLTSPGRTLFESLYCSKELRCLILFFLNMFNVACWCCLLLPFVHCWAVQCLMLGKGAVQITQRIFHCVGVWARPGRSHCISNCRSSSLGGGNRRSGCGTLLMPWTDEWNYY